jgi:DNA helicase-2/ATP-dependent DNA helicase PcrA
LHKIKEAKEAVEDLTSLWNGGTVPTFGEVLDSVYHTGLFLLPETLQVLAATRSDQSVVVDETSRDEEMAAWDRVLNTPFIQAASYDRYISGTSPFDTHQGVKGREFPRVMVVIDDSDSRGFMFSYEKLFGVREKTRNDL